MKQHSDSSYPTKLNKHPVLVEEDIVFVRFIGSYEPEEAEMLLGLVERVARERGQAFFLGDLTHAEIPSPATRRVLSKWRSHTKFVCSYFGVRWAIRAAANMIHSVIRLVGGARFPVYYSQTESEARAWIAEQRPSSTG